MRTTSTTTTNDGTALRDEMFRALVAAPKDTHRNEPSAESPQVSTVAFLSGATLAAATVGLLTKLATREARIGLAASAGTLAIFGLARWQLARLFTERAPYMMERRVGALEIRRFAAQRCAETSVDASSFEAASSEAFARLAHYIFGHGIAMTTPVVIARSDRPGSEVLPDWRVSVPSAGEGRYTMRFFLPPDRTLGELPSPDDDRVHLRELAAHRSIAMRFRGPASGAGVVAAEKRLLSSARHALLTVRGEPMFAGFDAPRTLSLLRRNEVWINLA